MSRLYWGELDKEEWNVRQSPQIKTTKKSVLFGWLRIILLLVTLYVITHFAFGIKIVNGHLKNHPTIHDHGIIVVSEHVVS